MLDISQPEVFEFRHFDGLSLSPMLGIPIAPVNFNSVNLIRLESDDLILDLSDYVPISFSQPVLSNAGPDPQDALRWGSVLEGASDPGTLIITYHLQPEMKDWVQIEFLQVHALDWDLYEQQQVRLAFDVIEQYIDVEFVEVDNAADAMFNLGVMSSLVFSFVLGRMVPPGEEDAGFGFFNRRGLGWDRDGDGGIEIGGSAFEVIIHELGHGLGLAHPHDDGGTSTPLLGVTDSDDLGDFNLNQGVFTIMSYNDGWVLSPAGVPDTQDFGYNASFGPLDLAVLQDLYGANPTTGAGNTIYILPESNEQGTYYSSIWDVGGTDTLVATGTAGAVINLNPASLQYETGGGGFVSFNNGILGGYTIANGVTIENAVGSAGADILIGNSTDNILAGGHGNDEMTGGAGADIFLIERGAGTDTILDFEDGADLILFAGNVFGFSSLSMRQDGNDVVIKSTNGLLILSDTALADIDITDFSFRQYSSGFEAAGKNTPGPDQIAILLDAIVSPIQNDKDSSLADNYGDASFIDLDLFL